MSLSGGELVPFGGPAEYPQLIAEFLRRYQSAKTRQQYFGQLHALFESTRKPHPRLLTESDVIDWCGQAVANNSIRNRLSMCCVFVRCCVRHGEADPELLAALTDKDNPLLHIPRVYGKAQSKHAARFLSYEQAFGQLDGACHDRTEVGQRDELVIRLGLTGMRVAEIMNLRVSSLRFTESPPLIQWLGKGRRPRQAVAGRTLIDLLADYLNRYQRHAGRPVTDDDYVISRGKPGGGVFRGYVSYGNRIKMGAITGFSSELITEFPHV